MAIARTGADLRHLSTLLRVGAVGGLSDGHLLERFLARRDEAAELAFAVLVERHGPMVLRVCRGILRNPHDAQDAFQATFLVLVRRAASIRRRDSLASWLHGVACRVARSARSASARRREHEQRRSALAVHASVQSDDLDLAPVLHEEIERLPARYRAAIVACHLQGLTHEQAAARLGWPLGTVRSRLARGRERLRVRLLERGVAPSAAVLGLALSQQSAAAVVPGSLVNATVGVARSGATAQTLAPGVVSLARGVSSMVSIKGTAGVIILALAAFGAAGVGRGSADRTGEAQQDPKAAPQAAVPPAPKAIELEARTTYDPDRLSRVRLRFDARVEKCFVAVGHSVNKGDPLVDLYSSKLAADKSVFRTKCVQWWHDKKLYDLREKLFQTGAIARQLWEETENNEQKSRREYELARDKLRVSEVPQVEIERLEEAFRGPPDGRKPSVVWEERSKMTLFAKDDALVIKCNAVPGNFYGNNDVLMILAPLDHLWVVANLPERLRDRVQVGQRAEVEFPFLEQKLSTLVDYVADEVTQHTRSIMIRAAIPNPGARLKADILMRLRIMMP
jgi:RNA polymerase sigma factor (sigma-70 family)